VNKDHLRETTNVVFIERWSLFRGQFVLELAVLGLRNMVFVEKMVFIRRWSFKQV